MCVGNRQGSRGFTLIELMIVVAIIGILAAVAIPSYQDYTARAEVTEAMSLASQFKTALTEYYTDKGNFSGVQLTDMGGTTSGRYVQSVAFSNANQATIVITATFNTSGVAHAIQGKTFSMETGDGGKTWKCGQITDVPANPVDSKYVPSACK